MPPSTQPQHRRIHALDGLRGVAAVVVLIHHVLLFIPFLARLEHGGAPDGLAQYLLGETPLRIVWAGDEAVILFFVLSGFALAAPVLQNPRFRWSAYYPSRIVRLYVPVIGAVALSIAVLATAPLAVAATAAAFAPRPGTIDVLSVLRDATLVSSPTALNNPMWSLHYELAFSLLLPLYALGARRIRRPGVAAFVMIAISTAGVVTHTPLLQFMPVFALGVLYARHRRPVSEWVQHTFEALPFAGPVSALAAAALLPVMWYPLPASLHVIAGWPVLLVAAATLLVLAAEWAPLRSVLSGAVARRLGRLSFSLYLTHMPVLLGLHALLGTDHTVLLLVVGPPITIAVAVVFQRIVESPGHRLARATARMIEAGSRRKALQPVPAELPARTPTPV